MSSPKLERTLGLYVCISLVVGAVIGSSIFMKPSTMAAQLGSPLLVVLVWIVGGFISFLGGSINAEIGTLLPNTGGQFIYFKNMYGDLFAFIYGWVSFVVINTASIAAMAYVFAEYANYFVQLPRFSESIEQQFYIFIPGLGKLYFLKHIGTKMLTIFILIIITLVNMYSIKVGGILMVIFSSLKILSLLFLIGIIFFSGKGSISNLTTSSSTLDTSFWSLFTSFFAACSGALAGYDGWNNIGYVAGEIKNPTRNIPLALFIGLGICTALYILTNMSYYYMMPIEAASASSLIATDSLMQIVPWGAAIVAIMVMISTYGSVSNNVLPCARITFAMGEQKSFFSWASVVHPKFKTPINSLILQCYWACGFVLIGSYDMLIDMFVFAQWIFYGFAAFGIFVLRKKMANVHRPYKAWGYPYMPMVFICFAVLYFCTTVYNDIHNYIIGETEFIYSIYGLCLAAAGFPFYYFFKKRNLAHVESN